LERMRPAPIPKRKKRMLGSTSADAVLIRLHNR